MPKVVGVFSIGPFDGGLLRDGFTSVNYFGLCSFASAGVEVKAGQSQGTCQDRCTALDVQLLRLPPELDQTDPLHGRIVPDMNSEARAKKNGSTLQGHGCLTGKLG